MSVAVGVFADSTVGINILMYLLEKHKNDVKYVVVNDSKSEIVNIISDYSIEIIESSMINTDNAQTLLGGVDFIFLVWWPNIVDEFIIKIPRVGVINTHPSLLPYNRGKNYNFWTIVENTPFGVTLHFVDSTIDGGDIIYQKEIKKSWEDTGETLYFKAQLEMCRLFVKYYSSIVNGEFNRIPQDLSIGTFHYAKELDSASKLELNNSYVARDLLNLLRARTFDGYPSCYFIDNNKRYEVRISIKEVEK